MRTAAVIGGGSVGTALVRSLSELDSVTVRLGRRDPEDRTGVPDAVEVRTPAEAAKGADWVFLAVPASAAVEVAAGLGLSSGQVLVDCTNPLAWDAGPVHTPPPEGSVTAALQARLPAVPILKALNHFGAEVHGNPGAFGRPAAMVAGDDVDARGRLLALLDDLGFEGLDAGPLRNAAHLESLAVLWIHVSTAGGVGRNWTFGRRVVGGA